MTTENRNELYAALAAAQAEMGHAVLKDASNPHFRSSYATLGAVLEVAMPVLPKYGLALLQFREGDNLITELGHKSGQCIRTSYPLEPVKKDPQGWGSAMTYARRYQAMALLGLAPEDDDGNEASQRQPRPQPQQKAPPKAAPAPAPVKGEASSQDASPPEWAVKGAAWFTGGPLASMGAAVIRERVFGADAPADVVAYFSAPSLASMGQAKAREELGYAEKEWRIWKAERQGDAA